MQNEIGINMQKICDSKICVHMHKICKKYAARNIQVIYINKGRYSASGITVILRPNQKAGLPKIHW